MKEPSKKNDEFIISLSDLLHIFRRAKRKIFLGILGFSTLSLIYAIQQPVKYEAKATFREKSNALAVSDSSAIAAMLFSGNESGTNSSAISTMKSRKLIEKVIQKGGLQASLDDGGWHFPRLSRLIDNVRIELYLLANSRKPALNDSAPILSAKEVYYPGEIPLSLKIYFNSNRSFEVFEKEQKIGDGTLDIPFHGRDYAFTLYSDSDHPLDSTSFSIDLLPMNLVLKDFIANLKIETDYEDSTLIKLQYKHTDRHQAAALLNDLMLAYQDYLKEEQKRISSEQVTYLRSREEEMTHQLKHMMEAYGEKVSKDLYHIGFASAEAALDFLTKQLLALEEKTSAIDLKLKRLEKAKESSVIYEAAFFLDTEHAPIQNSLNEITELKQQSDSIEIALRNSPIKNQEELKAAFIKQIYDLEEVKIYTDEAQTLLSSLENGVFPPPSDKLFNNPHFLAKEWYEKLLKSRKTQAFNENKNQYISYLANLNRYLQVQQKTIEERLSHQQSLQLDFQGINLQTAKELYYKFSTSLSQIESDIAEKKFILKQMDEPDFEISSLSNVLKDSVSGKMIEKASQFVLQLNDERNRSEMEKERLKKELAVQERFLTLHLNQNLQLLELSESLLREKIYSIQSATLELIHQKISVIEKQLAEFVDSRIGALQEERSLIAQHQQNIRGDMAKLSKKWVAETLIQQHLRVNEKMAEEITKLVESKNIANNLEMIQSAPLDLAYPPLQPKSPKLLFFTLLGGLLGAFFTMSGVVASAIRRGIPVSKENLELADVHVAGTISSKKDDLETLRRLSAYFKTADTSSNKSLLFLQGKGPNYIRSLASLLKMQGDSVIVLSLDFNEKSEGKEGILPYIEGKIPQPKITSIDGLDTMAAGGYSPYGYELVQNKSFQELLSKLKSEYTWVITTCSITPDTAEAQGLIPLFDSSIINVHDEKLQDLAPIIKLAKDAHRSHKISFVINI